MSQWIKNENTFDTLLQGKQFHDCYKCVEVQVETKYSKINAIVTDVIELGTCLEVMSIQECGKCRQQDMTSYNMETYFLTLMKSEEQIRL